MCPFTSSQIFIEEKKEDIRNTQEVGIFSKKNIWLIYIAKFVQDSFQVVLKLLTKPQYRECRAKRKNTMVWILFLGITTAKLSGKQMSV